MKDARGLNIADDADVPRTFRAFTQRFPEIARAHEATGKAAGSAGPLDRKTCELIQLGMCVGAGLESAAKSHTRRALQHGATRQEIEQAIALGVNTCGLPRAVMVWQWATEQIEQEAS